MQARPEMVHDGLRLLGGGERNKARATRQHRRSFYGIGNPRKANITASTFLENLDDGQEPVAPFGDRQQIEAVSGTECLNNFEIVLEFRYINN